MLCRLTPSHSIQSRGAPGNPQRINVHSKLSISRWACTQYVDPVNRYADSFVTMACPTGPVNLTKRIHWRSYCLVYKDIQTHPEINCNRLSLSPTFSEPCASSLGMILRWVDFCMRNRTKTILTREMIRLTKNRYSLSPSNLSFSPNVSFPILS